MAMLDEVTLIIPQRGGAELTLQCLAGLFAHEPDVGAILVVDDGSPDDSADEVERGAGARATVLRSAPHGVTAAWNRGIKAAATRWVVLLNNDVLIQGPWLSALLQPLREDSAVISGVRWRIERMLPADLQSRLPTLRLLEGWCLAFARTTWRQLSGFEASLQLYWSDTDFQCRVVRQHGHRALQVVDRLPLEHLGHRTTRRSADRQTLWRADRQRFIELWTQNRLPPAGLLQHSAWHARRSADGRGH